MCSYILRGTCLRIYKHSPDTYPQSKPIIYQEREGMTQLNIRYNNLSPPELATSYSHIVRITSSGSSTPERGSETRLLYILSSCSRISWQCYAVDGIERLFAVVSCIKRSIHRQYRHVASSCYHKGLAMFRPGLGYKCTSYCVSGVVVS